MSPECLRGLYTEKLDVWSLGVVLYAMISAEFPFEGSTDNEIKKNILAMKFTQPIQKLHASDTLKDLLTKIFTVEEKRPSAGELFEHPWIKE